MIVGGESGPGARPMKPEWVTSIRDQCREQKVPFFFKQWGGVQKKKHGRLLEGKTYDQLPPVVHGAAPPKVPAPPSHREERNVDGNDPKRLSN